MNVEQAFNECVKQLGGELVQDLLPKSPPVLNADYLFRNDPSELVVAELKCLTKDLFREGYQEKVDALYECWIRQRLVRDIGFGTFKIQTKDLPPECQNDLFNLLRQPLKRPIRKANDQIKMTKQHFGLPHAKGLLLLVNDGNYSLESSTVLYLTNRILGNVHSGINSIVYFTVNMATTIPGLDRDALVWIQAQREGYDPVSEKFLARLAQGWMKFFENKIGETVPIVPIEDHTCIEQARFRRPTNR
jgi:hypothetical protein